MRTKWIFGATLAITSLASSAIDTQTASINAQNARKLAHQGRFSEAFTEIGWLLKDGSPSIRRYAEEVLREHPQIARLRLAGLTTDKFIESACEDGVGAAANELNKEVDSIAPFSSETEASEARSKIVNFSSTQETADLIAQCQSDKKKRETDEENAAAQRVKSANLQAASRIKELSTLEFCADYGDVLRGRRTYPYELINNLDQLFSSEASRRRIRLNKDLVKQEKIKLGIDACTLYASWGYPDRVNRSVGRWGSHSQLVYGDHGPYVYIQNGIVSSYQD